MRPNIIKLFVCFERVVPKTLTKVLFKIKYVYTLCVELNDTHTESLAQIVLFDPAKYSVHNLCNILVSEFISTGMDFILPDTKCSLEETQSITHYTDTHAVNAICIAHPKHPFRFQDEIIHKIYV